MLESNEIGVIGLERVIDVRGTTKAILLGAFIDFFNYLNISLLYLYGCMNFFVFSSFIFVSNL